jgi:hypothetical protein
MAGLLAAEDPAVVVAASVLLLNLYHVASTV